MGLLSRFRIRSKIGFEECSKKEAIFTAETLANFIDNSFYELNNVQKVDQRLVRSVESGKLDLRRFGAKFRANSSRPYFLGHERKDAVKHREQFVKYFIEEGNHFNTIRNDAAPRWKTPTTAPTILLCKCFSFLYLQLVDMFIVTFLCCRS